MFLKKIRVVILILLIVSFSGCKKNNIRDLKDIIERGKITVVTNAVFPPFEYYKFNNIEGIDIDIAREVAKDIGVELEILEMNFDGVIAAIASGKGDFVAAGLTRDPKKEKAISFSDDYILVPQSLILINNKINNKINNEIDALKDKKIGVQIGTTSDKYIRDNIKNGFLKNSLSELVEKKEYLDLVIDLRNNRLDVIALDGFIAREIVKRNKDLIYFDRDSENYALAVKKGNDDLLKKINQTIKRLLDQDKIKEFYKKHYDYKFK
ncbi:MAG: transporter substrate-binding domain-containing protein [Oscillospiraceae bacterium]|nr:transporter substrate-binding domain-containing protein [Oscillospiraceae bacterium]